jgi:sulfur-oxidizing protein SoxY
MNAAPPTRRQWLAQGAGAWLALSLRPARADEAELQAALRSWAGAAPVREGRVTLDVSPLVENGNAVPLTVRVQSPMTAADHVQAIAVFNAMNPQRDLLRATLGPRAGRAEVATRVRLATSQKLVALARLSDGSVWSHSVEVVVTLAACVE